jgi:hypothetical protein
MSLPGHLGVVCHATRPRECDDALLAALKTGPGFAYVRDCNGVAEPGYAREHSAAMRAHLAALGWQVVNSQRGDVWGPPAVFWDCPAIPDQPPGRSPEMAAYLARR